MTGESVANQVQPYVPMCVICGPSTRCDQPVIEGVVRRVEPRTHQTNAGSLHTVDIHLVTANGACLLSLGERYQYVAHGLTDSPDGLTLRAYHLRRGRDPEVATGS